MIKGIDLNQRIEYVSPLDTGDVKTVFVFKPLSASEMIDLTGSETTITLKGKQIIQYLNETICEIRNAEFSDKKTFIDSLSSNMIAELIVQASTINNMTVQDQKN
jgi:hypothetical protein